MRGFLPFTILGLLLSGVVTACSTPTSPAPPPITPTPTMAATIEANPSVTVLPTESVPLPTITLSAGYPPPFVRPTSLPSGYPAPFPTNAPQPTLTRFPPTPRIAPTVPIAPDAIGLENAPQLKVIARITPPSRVGREGGPFPSGPIWDVAITKNEARVAVAQPDGVFIYDLTNSQPLNYIDTGSAPPIRIYFSNNDRELMASSSWDSSPRGATFFDIASGQRAGMLRVPWPALPNLGTWAFPSPNGQVLVVQQGQSARFYDMQTRQPLTTWPKDWFPATAIVFSPDSQLAAISFSGVAVWEVASGKLLFTPTPPNTSTTQQPLAAFSPDGQLLATADGRTLHLWEVLPPRERFQIPLNSLYATSLTFSPNGQHLSVATDSQVSVWSVRTGERLLTTSGYAPQFSPNSQRFVVQSGNAERVSLWDVNSSQKARFTVSGSAPQFVADNRLLIQVITNTYAFVDESSGTLSPTFYAQRVFSLKDGRLLDVRDDGSVRLLAGDSGQPITTLALRAKPSPATSVAFRADGRVLISSGNGTVRLDALVDEDPYNPPPSVEQGGWIYQIALAPDGKTVGSVSKDGRLALFNSDDLYALPSDSVGPVSEPTTHELTSLAFAPDGLRVAVGGSDYNVRVWLTEAPSLTPTLTLKGHTNWVWGVAFSPNGQQIASASPDKTIQINDAFTGQPLFILHGHTATVRSIAYTPDSRFLVSGSWDGTLKVWDANNGALLRTISGHTAQVNAVALSPNGKLIASASHDGTVRLWGATLGREVKALKPEGGAVWSVAFSLDGRQLAVALDDGSVVIWEAP